MFVHFIGFYLLPELVMVSAYVLNYDSVTICDGMEKLVKCPNNDHIHVLQGFYGKWKNHDCKGIKMDPRNLPTCSKDRKETTEKVRKVCQGVNQCSFVADRSIYGDPCPDNDAYLYVTFFCMTPGQKLVHKKDKNNKEVVTVASHGYLVSENKHKPDTEAVNSQTDSQLSKKLTKLGEISTVAKEDDHAKENKLSDSDNSLKLAAESKPEKHPVIPVRDERKKIRTPGNKTTIAVDSAEKREGIYDRMLRVSTICNGQSKLIACLPDERIQVHAAFYGKKPGRDCHGILPYKDDSPTCSALDAKSNVQHSCDSKQTCLLFADENIFGRSLCPNVNKYLHMSYVCLPRQNLPVPSKSQVLPVQQEDLEEDAVSRSYDSNQGGKKNRTIIICNGERHAISCKSDVGMHIVSAFYGKKNGKDCRGDLEYRDDIPDCINPRALDSVKFLCENRKSCELASEKELFGDDTCVGVNKYLSVRYIC